MSWYSEKFILSKVGAFAGLHHSDICVCLLLCRCWIRWIRIFEARSTCSFWLRRVDLYRKRCVNPHVEYPNAWSCSHEWSQFEGGAAAPLSAQEQSCGRTHPLKIFQQDSCQQSSRFCRKFYRMAYTYSIFWGSGSSIWGREIDGAEFEYNM